MGQLSIARQLNESNNPPSTLVQGIQNVDGNYWIAQGNTVPTDTTRGYLPGCIFEDTDSAIIYVNEGTAASSSFKAIATATTLGSYLPLAGGTLAEAANIVLGTTTGTKIATAAAQKLGFHNATPVIQYATVGTTTGFTAGAGTAVLSDSTFTGGSGTKAYTVGDIVLALKTKGLMAPS